MSNYVNFKLLGKALEQTKSYKNQQIDRNFYLYLKKIGCSIRIENKMRYEKNQFNQFTLLSARSKWY